MTRSLIISFLFCICIASADTNCELQNLELSAGKALLSRGQNLLGVVRLAPLLSHPCPAQKAARLYYTYGLSELGETNEAIKFTDEFMADPNFQKLRAYLTLDENVNADVRTWIHRHDKTSLNLTLVQTHDRSPTLSGILSAVAPGTGQAYAGAWQSAALSLALNAIFLSAALEFARKDLIAPAIASSLVFSITYVGGILSAVAAVHRRNLALEAAPERELKRSLFPEFVP